MHLYNLKKEENLCTKYFFGKITLQKLNKTTLE